MKTLEFRAWRLALVAMAAGTIGTSAVQAQIGPVATELPEPVRPVTISGSGSGKPSTLYGTSDLTAHTLQAYAFEPSTTAGNAFGTNGFYSRYCTTGNCFLVAPLLLPAGALIESIELAGCDTSASAFMAVNLVRIDAFGSEGAGLAFVGTGLPETPGCEFFSVDLDVAETVDNVNSSYVVQVQLADGDDSTHFQAVRVFYRLQVSPPPGSATFNDVPTDHLFFPFIEALAASGITGGCGDGNFCPNAPLTRGQMAAFLAKALGLHWAP